MLAMTWRSAKIKLLSVFVLTFLCLNAGGALCVAYCQGSTKAEAKADHCPLAKFGAHCPKSKSPIQSGLSYVEFNDNSMDCCVLSVSFIAAPIEKRYTSVAATHAVIANSIPSIFPLRTLINSQPNAVEYSPPLRDRQFTHIRNRVLRI
jgi:hypothetical protein